MLSGKINDPIVTKTRVLQPLTVAAVKSYIKQGHISGKMVTTLEQLERGETVPRIQLMGRRTRLVDLSNKI